MLIDTVIVLLICIDDCLFLLKAHFSTKAAEPKEIKIRIDQTCTTEGEIMEIRNHRFYSCNFTIVLSIPAECLLHVDSEIS